jgi:hypothetical protein
VNNIEFVFVLKISANQKKDDHEIEFHNFDSANQKKIFFLIGRQSRPQMNENERREMWIIFRGNMNEY